MYQNLITIDSPIWNNIFSYEIRKNKEIFVPTIIDWTINDAQIWNKPTFIEIDEKWIEQVYFWLKNFIKTNWNKVPVYIFDNHNHAFYFWCEALNNWVINKWINLIHIDEHSDTRNPDNFIDEKDLNNLNKVYEYTNYKLNVWNYISPAIKSELIWNLYKITGESEILSFDENILKEDFILNLDLDFFSPNMDYISYNLKRDFILRIAKKSRLITIATSPYFIDQKKALEVLRDLFG